MIVQNLLLNSFVAGSRQMLNLVSQNKHYARKHIVILQPMTSRMVEGTADLVTFTEEIHNGKLQFLCSDSSNTFLRIK